MNWLVGLGLLLMAALLLWAFSALFISMLAGLAGSDSALAHARELLDLARQRAA